MTDTLRTRVEELFEAALEQAPATRAAWLRAAAADDPAVLREVAELLAAHELAAGVLEGDVADALRRFDSNEGRRIGVYRVIRELGRGGMGVVYLAERDDGQFRRRVAVKLLRSSPNADELYERFVAERHILALLDHPNIAQLIDAGIADGRVPYLVMEYVEGLSITQYCESHGLTLTERLRLFQKVCDAVHHAHSNLVIHRDLKPGNILVTATGQVKLLDFGIAKLLNPALSQVAAPVTQAWQRVFTTEYASPEQLRGEPLTTASDVYALGVILYELLGCRRPHEADLQSQDALAQRICNEEPVRPSEVCGNRLLRGDVDAITMMALRKEPGRRYGSVDLLAQDIQRYLDGLPVLAHNGSRAYYVQRFVRRHRVPVAAAALVALSILGGAGVAVRESVMARHQRDQAQQAQRESEEVTGFLVSMFEANDPYQAHGEQTTARDLLRRGLQRVDNMRDQPLLQARLLDAIGRVHHSIGEYEESRALHERALGIREANLGAGHLDVAETLSHLAQALRFLSRFDEAEAATQRALDIRRRALGPDHPEIATSLLDVAMMAVYRLDVKRAITLTRQALAIREAALGPHHPAVAEALITLGGRLGSLGEYSDAESYVRRAVAIQRQIGPEHADLASALLSLAYLLDEVPGRAAEAEALYRQGLQMRRAALGPDHPLSNYALGDYVIFLADQNRFEEALPLVLQHYEAAKRLFGPDNAMTLLIGGTYARVLYGVGRKNEAIEIVRSSLAMRARIFGGEHAVYAGGLTLLAFMLNESGKPAEAESLLQQAIAIRKRVHGSHGGGLAALAYADLSSIQAKGGRYAEAEQSLVQAIEILDESGVRPTHKDYRYMLDKAVQLYDAMHKAATTDQLGRLVAKPMVREKLAGSGRLQ